jgi:hypothetical protein
VLLEALISEVGRCLVFLSFILRCSSFIRVLLALPFYRLKERIRLTTSPRRCLRGEGGAGTIGVAVATCPVHAYHPWLGTWQRRVDGKWIRPSPRNLRT